MRTPVPRRVTSLGLALGGYIHHITEAVGRIFIPESARGGSTRKDQVIDGPARTVNSSRTPPSIRERLDRLRLADLEVAQRYGASNLRVFGSVALNQEHQDSDLDLLVD